MTVLILILIWVFAHPNRTFIKSGKEIRGTRTIQNESIDIGQRLE